MRPRCRLLHVLRVPRPVGAVLPSSRRPLGDRHSSGRGRPVAGPAQPAVGAQADRAVVPVGQDEAVAKPSDPRRAPIQVDLGPRQLGGERGRASQTNSAAVGIVRVAPLRRAGWDWARTGVGAGPMTSGLPRWITKNAPPTMTTATATAAANAVLDMSGGATGRARPADGSDGLAMTASRPDRPGRHPDREIGGEEGSDREACHGQLFLSRMAFGRRLQRRPDRPGCVGIRDFAVPRGMPRWSATSGMVSPRP